MKRSGITIIKVLVFIIGFCFLFLQIQKVLHYHWVEKEDIYSTNIYLKTQPSDSFDVVFFGTSELKTAVFPGAIYQETGVTSFNYAVTNKSAMTVYYQLEYLLRYQKPKVVCCDFSALYDDCMPGDRETIYRKMVDTMPDRDIKWEMIQSICDMDEQQSMLTYIFPMLRYHSIWNELTEVNFQKDYVYNEEFPGYGYGCSLIEGEYSGNATELTPDMWIAEPTGEQLSEVSVEWYDKFITLCHANDIKVVAIYPPAFGFAQTKEETWDTTLEYLEARGVDIIDYNNYDAVMEFAFDLEEDYLDATHMKYKGSLKVSKHLANVLKERYNLPDHRTEETDTVWQQQWQAFCEDYEVN